MVTVIMAGGFGERFWPRSRRSRPKQLIDLTGRGPMISLTVDRALRLAAPDEVFIITNARQEEAIAAATAGRVLRSNVIGEPVGRNTAATVGVAAVLVKTRFGDRPFLVVPADHVIGDLEVYDASVRAAEAFAAREEQLLTFGIRPTSPDTGYGYVEAGKVLEESGGVSVCRAEGFHEKPSPERAREYLTRGNYYWNSGMFVWRAGVILRAIKEHVPDLYHLLQAFEKRTGTGPIGEVLKPWYHDAPAVSIDYGVMEKAGNVAVVKGEFYWNDVGSWESIRELYPADGRGNVLVGDHVVLDGSRNTVFAPERTIGVIGVDDLVVVDSGDAILVCRRDQVQRVRDIVRMLKETKRNELI